MLTRRLTLAVIAALFGASSSLAMLQNARPVAAHPHEHWRHEHHQRFDRDDRHRHHHHHHAYVNDGYVYNGYANPAYYNSAYYNSVYYNPAYYGTTYYNPGYVRTAPYYTPRHPHYNTYGANRSWNARYAWTRPHPDRDDRRWHAAHGNRYGWNEPNNPHHAGYRKPHGDPWRDHRWHR
jgi:hypothetical protein